MRLLQETSLPVTAIAGRVGYDDVAFFSRIFHRYLGVSPRQARVNERNASPEPAQHVPPPSSEWCPLTETDFRDGGCLDTRWRCYHQMNRGSATHQQPAPARITVRDGALHLLPYPEWTQLRWEAEAAEEVRVEVTVVNTPPEGPNLAIALSGDLVSGYRLRVEGYAHLELETVRHGYWEVLFHCPTTLDSAMPVYTFTLQRAECEFIATVNGQRIMTYYDPSAPYGPAHRTFALGRFWSDGSAILTSL